MAWRRIPWVERLGLGSVHIKQEESLLPKGFGGPGKGRNRVQGHDFSFRNNGTFVRGCHWASLIEVSGVRGRISEGGELVP